MKCKKSLSPLVFIGLSYFLLAVLPSSAQMRLSFPAQDPLLDSIISGDGLLRDSSIKKVQIIYTEINRMDNGMPSFTDHFSNISGRDYFSSNMVHLPLAVSVLKKMQSIRDSGVDLNTTMITEADFGEQMPAYNDPRWPEGRPAVGRYLRNMLLLRDKSSFNRLYELVGQEMAAEALIKNGYAISYTKRLINEDEINARHTNPVNFYNNNRKIIARLPSQYNNKPYPKLNNDSDTNMVNSLNLESLHRFLTAIIFPETTLPEKCIGLAPNDRKLLLQYMSQRADETIYPLYDTLESGITFFEAFFPEDSVIRVFATGGVQGSQVIESAYIIDPEYKIEFLLTIAVESKSEEVVKKAIAGMGKYAADIYYYETGRKRKAFPNLSPFLISYDK